MPADLHGHLSNEALVTCLYRSLLNREPDADGLHFYKDQLDLANKTPEDLIRAFMSSEEFRQQYRSGGFSEVGGPQAIFKNGLKQTGPYSIVEISPELYQRGLVHTSYMSSANCRMQDFFHDEYRHFCAEIAHAPVAHRKLWEFAFIAHHLGRSGALRRGARGVGFGVGTEQMPSYFASLGCRVVATDAPPEITHQGWKDTRQHGASLDDIFHEKIVSREMFDHNVSFAFADMNTIGPDLTGFDFCWSSCCFEHLGSIEKGLDFVVASVEETLKIGGVACHTSELNLTSNDETVDNDGTVLFRKRDIEALISRLEGRGHRCAPLPIAPGLSFADYLVDLPPFSGDPHLKIKLGAFVTTSFGIVVTRGR